MPHSDQSNTWDTIWRFLRGDTSVRDFERWVYETPVLESILGNDLYMRLLAANYADPDTVLRLRSDLETAGRSGQRLLCECVTLSNTAVVDMANPGSSMAHFENVAERGEPYWWLSAERCGVCGTGWLVAQEERQNDVFLLRRITQDQLTRIMEQQEWPNDFDRYETLLRLGAEAGHRAVFADPVGDSSLRWSMQDLARERSRIRLSELASLLNVDLATARVIAVQAISNGADIDLESP
jgi:hypothetical protein